VLDAFSNLVDFVIRLPVGIKKFWKRVTKKNPEIRIEGQQSKSHFGVLSFRETPLEQRPQGNPSFIEKVLKELHSQAVDVPELDDISVQDSLKNEALLRNGDKATVGDKSTLKRIQKRRRLLFDYLDGRGDWSSLVGRILETEVEILTIRMKRLRKDSGNEEADNKQLLSLMKSWQKEVLEHVVCFRRTNRKEAVIRAINGFDEKSEEANTSWKRNIVYAGLFLTFSILLLLTLAWSEMLQESQTSDDLQELGSRLRKLKREVDIFPQQSELANQDIRNLRSVIGKWETVFDKSPPSPFVEPLSPFTLAESNHEAAHNLRDWIDHMLQLSLNADTRRQVLSSRLETQLQDLKELETYRYRTAVFKTLLIALGIIALGSIMVFCAGLVIRFARYHLLLRNFYTGRSMTLKVLLKSGQVEDGSVGRYQEILGAETLDLGDMGLTPMEEAIMALRRVGDLQTNVKA